MANKIKGVLGKKLGMTQVFDADNRMVMPSFLPRTPLILLAMSVRSLRA